ncbi:hypothetical protein I3842_11G053500 [Carya illinoinensis]|uniref:FCP1 homology domain-containing protein n=1 Tax=Carya illinoinensis TaxID=32201 RepID=A0A922IZJ3_CARIL|nr:hypothetical protein I3842_11G053500 [Carya illinoinensis]
MTGSGMPQSNLESKKRRTERGLPTALEVDQSLQSPVKSCLVLEEEMAGSHVEVSCSQVKVEGKEQNERHIGSEVKGMDCDLQEVATNVKHFGKDEKNTVSEVSEMNSADVKHKTLVLGEHVGFIESANAGFTEKCDDDLKNKCILFDQKNLKTYSREKRGRTVSETSEVSSTSFQNSLESIKDDTQGLMNQLLGEVPTAELMEKLDTSLSGEHAAIKQVMKDKLIVDASFNYMNSELASKDCKERSKMTNLENNLCEISFVNDASVPDVPKDHKDHKYGGKHHMNHITGQYTSHVNDELDKPASYGNGITTTNLSGCDPSYKHLEQMDVEIAEMKASPSDLGVVEDDTDSGIVVKEHKFSEILESASEKSLLDSSKKKLLILDLNGLLADIVPYVPNGYNADIMISGKAVFKRPFCDDFLQFCFDRFVVGVWSSRTKRNMDRLIDILMGASRHKLLFCWDQSHCTSTGFSTVENKEKPMILKELRKLWEKLEPNLPWEKGEYNEANTLLVDDSPYKALLNPVNTAIFPHTYQYWNVEDMSLGPGGDLRVYMEGLAMAKNVQKYVQENPFGQRAITESNLSWGFYRKVIEIVNAHPPQDDSNTTNAHQPQDDANT